MSLRDETCSLAMAIGSVFDALNLIQSAALNAERSDIVKEVKTFKKYLLNQSENFTRILSSDAMMEVDNDGNGEEQ